MKPAAIQAIVAQVVYRMTKADAVHRNRLETTENASVWWMNLDSAGKRKPCPGRISNRTSIKIAAKPG